MSSNRPVLLPSDYSIDLDSTKKWIRANHSSIFFQVCFALFFFLWAKPNVDRLHIPLLSAILLLTTIIFVTFLVYRHWQYI
jgi:hypothetical protein